MLYPSLPTSAAAPSLYVYISFRGETFDNMVEIVHSSLLKNANLKLHRLCWQEPPLPFSSLWAAEGWLGNPEAARFQVPELEAGSSAPGLTVMYVRAPQCQSDAGQEQKSERCIKCS